MRLDCSLDENESAKGRTAVEDCTQGLKRQRICPQCEHIDEIERLKKELNDREEEIFSLQKILASQEETWNLAWVLAKTNCVTLFSCLTSFLFFVIQWKFACFSCLKFEINFWDENCNRWFQIMYFCRRSLNYYEISQKNLWQTCFR